MLEKVIPSKVYKNTKNQGLYRIVDLVIDASEQPNYGTIVIYKPEDGYTMFGRKLDEFKRKFEEIE